MILLMVCGFCGVKQVPLQYHEATFKGLDEAETWDYVIHSLSERAPGWSPRSKDGKRCAICPDCQDSEKAPPVAIAEYTTSDACPKCRTGTMDARYCLGRLCPDTREHVHRQCQSCKYELVTKCADTLETPVPLARRWAHSIPTIDSRQTQPVVTVAAEKSPWRKSGTRSPITFASLKAWMTSRATWWSRWRKTTRAPMNRSAASW